MLAMTLRTELTLLGAEAMARQARLEDVLALRSRKLSWGKVMLSPWNMKVMLGMVVGAV